MAENSLDNIFQKIWIILSLGCLLIIILYSASNTSYSITLNTIWVSPQVYVFNNGENSSIQYDRKFKGKDSVPSYLKPQCRDVLLNMANGHWVKKDDKSTDLKIKESMLDDEIRIYRIKKGLYNNISSTDFTCGYRSTKQHSKGSHKLQVGNWCDGRSDKPCCSDLEFGKCTNTICSCTRCIDMRNIIHADVSEWMPKDKRCKRQSYTASEACDIINRANLTNLYFIGDSFLRKMYRAFVLTLTDDHDKGAQTKNSSDELKNLCGGSNQFYWPECRFAGTSLNDILTSNSLCGGKHRPLFNAYTYSYHIPSRLPKLLPLLGSIARKPGTVVLLSVGLHMNCNAQNVIEKFLKPVVNATRNSVNLRKETEKANLWPKLIFLPPVSAGLNKPINYLATQGNEACDKYARDMKIFCDKYNIAFLNFRNLTKNVVSFDGTHYGRAVNMMKVQIFLNYLSSLS